MVEEYMGLANTIIAKHLLKHFPNKALLRNQPLFTEENCKLIQANAKYTS